MSDAPFVITVFDGGMNRLGFIGDPLEVVMTERHNGVPTVQVTVGADHRMVEHLIAPGVRVAVDFIVRDSGGAQLATRRVSGPVRHRRAVGPNAAGEMTVTVEGDFRLLENVLGWPVPANPLTNQNVAYDTRTGAAETVLKGFVTANAVTRLGRPVTVATDQARGSSITVKSRFHPLFDRLLPAVEVAGLGVSVVQDDATKKLVVDVYVPSTHPRTLTESGGVVQSWEWFDSGPTATRVICGDQGEATARSFTTTIQSGRESSWSDVIEVFRDARDTSNASELAQRRNETIEEGRPKSGLRVVLSESGIFRYGAPGGVAVGDRVTLEVGPDLTITDILREAVISWTADNGLKVSPVVGEMSLGFGVLARAIQSTRRLVRDLLAGR